jgi:hypothetical protein
MSCAFLPPPESPIHQPDGARTFLWVVPTLLQLLEQAIE